MIAATQSLTETAVGYRQWLVSADRLVAISAGEEWPVGDVHAHCKHTHTTHAAPAENCSCGLYALHHWPYEPSEPDGYVWGIVAAWGQLQVHHDGFRAENMRPLALIAESDDARAAAAPVAARYRLPVVDTASAVLLGSEFGSVVPLNVRPDGAGFLLQEIIGAVTSRESVGTRFGWSRRREMAAFLDVLVEDPDASLLETAQIATDAVAGVGPTPTPAAWDRRMKAYSEAIAREIAATDAGASESGLAADRLLYALLWANGLTVTDVVSRLELDLPVDTWLALHPQVIARSSQMVRPLARRILEESADQRLLSADFAALALLDEFESHATICDVLVKLRSCLGVEAVLDAQPELAPAVARAIVESGRLLLLTPECVPHIPPSRLRSQVEHNAYCFGNDRLHLRELVGFRTLEAAAERLLRLSEDPVATAGAIEVMPDPDRARELIRPLARRALTFTPDRTQLRERFWRCLSDSWLVPLLEEETIVMALNTAWVETRTRVNIVDGYRAVSERYALDLWQRSDLDFYAARQLMGATAETQPALVADAVDRADATADDQRAALRLTAALEKARDLDERTIATAAAVASDRGQPSRLRLVAAWRLAKEGHQLPGENDPLMARFRTYQRTDPNWRERPQPPGPYGDFILTD